ncbi:MAG: hypothetical protein AB7O97_03015 [Planctomycetota bacterium]
MRRLQCCVWTFVMGAGLALAQDADPTPARVDGGPAAAATAPKGPAAAHGAAARAALAQARTLARAADGLDGDAEREALAAAATAYDRVADEFAAEPAAAAEASFRAAVLWCCHGSDDRAERDYLRAAGLDAARFGERGRFGAADMQRRQDRVDDALQGYAAVIELAPTSSRAQAARLWRGRLLQRRDRPDEAAREFAAAIAAARTARQAILACNLLARLQVERGDLTGADATLQRADAAAQREIDAAPERQPGLRRALDEMSARRALQRARDRALDAAGDAAALEAARGG